MIKSKTKTKVFIIVMKTYWLQVETKNLLTISTINGILNEICVKKIKFSFSSQAPLKRLSFSSFSDPIFQNHPFSSFPSFSNHCSHPARHYATLEFTLLIISLKYQVVSKQNWLHNRATYDKQFQLGFTYIVQTGDYLWVV